MATLGSKFALLDDDHEDVGSLVSKAQKEKQEAAKKAAQEAKAAARAAAEGEFAGTYPVAPAARIYLHLPLRLLPPPIRPRTGRTGCRPLSFFPGRPTSLHRKISAFFLGRVGCVWNKMCG